MFLQSCHGKSLQVEVSKTAQQKVHHRHLARAGECAAGSLPTVPNACKRHFCPTFHCFDSHPFARQDPSELRVDLRLLKWVLRTCLSPCDSLWRGHIQSNSNALQAWEAAFEMLRRRWHKHPPQRPSKPPCHKQGQLTEGTIVKICW